MRRVIHVCLGSGCSGCDWGWWWCTLLWNLATFRSMTIKRVLVRIIQIQNLPQLGVRGWDSVGLRAHAPITLGRKSILRSSLSMQSSKWVQLDRLQNKLGEERCRLHNFKTSNIFFPIQTGNTPTFQKELQHSRPHPTATSPCSPVTWDFKRSSSDFAATWSDAAC